MKTHEHIVKEIIKNSIADELGIEPGDKLLSINGQEIEDIFDYQFYSEDEEILLLIEKPDGEQWELEIEKDADEQLGMEFGSGLMDEYRSCRNKCISVLSTRCRKGCGTPCILKMMIPGCRSLQGQLCDAHQYERPMILSGSSATGWSRSIFHFRRPTRSSAAGCSTTALPGMP